MLLTARQHLKPPLQLIPSETLSTPRSLTDTSVPAATFLLVDDHEIIRLGLRRLIEKQPEWTVVGEASTIEEARQSADALHPQVTIVDLRLGIGDGVELIRHLQSAYPSMRVFVCSILDPLLYAERCFKAGACGYVTKGQPANDLVSALQDVLAGGNAFREEWMPGPSSLGKPSLESLSPRERQVYGMIGRGLSIKQIAGELGFGVKTAEYYRQQLKKKLRLASGAALARHAMINPLVVDEATAPLEPDSPDDPVEN